MLESISQLGLAFFGLMYDTVPQARSSVFTQIHEICFHGQGGYQWETVYNMPIWLRRFTFKQIQDFNNDQQDKLNSQNNSGETNLVDPTGKVNTPAFLESSKQYNSSPKYK